MQPPAVKPPPTVDAFVKNVLRSSLLQRAELADALHAVEMDGRGSSPELLAEHLVKTGKLTRFQAAKLLRGAAIGLVLGPFQVLSPLGKGGMGCVFLARDSRSKQLVALKVLPPKKARTQENLVARFQREMNLSKMLKHPHLAQSYDAGIFEGIHYIAMEFIPGQSLHKVVSGQGALPVPRAAKLFSEVCQGLEHAHGIGLIHRDLKPSNIQVTPNDHAKVLDVGLAIIQGEVASDRTIVGGQGYVVGTMDYLAPEQAEDALNVDARADIYGLGCTLYFTLTGRPPFPGGNALQKIMKHYSEEPTPAIQLNPSIPPAFHQILRKMMAKKPADRYASAAAVRKDLLPWCSKEPVKPLDSPDAASLQKVVTELDSAEIAPEMLKQDIVDVGRNRPPVAPVVEAVPVAEVVGPAPVVPVVVAPHHHEVWDATALVERLPAWLGPLRSRPELLIAAVLGGLLLLGLLGMLLKR